MGIPEEFLEGKGHVLLIYSLPGSLLYTQLSTLAGTEPDTTRICSKCLLYSPGYSG